jgi:hypothetical protein
MIQRARASETPPNNNKTQTRSNIQVAYSRRPVALSPFHDVSRLSPLTDNQS